MSYDKINSDVPGTSYSPFGAEGEETSDFEEIKIEIKDVDDLDEIELIEDEDIVENSMELSFQDLQLEADFSCCRKISDFQHGVTEIDQENWEGYYKTALELLSTLNFNQNYECLINEMRNSIYCVLTIHTKFEVDHMFALNFVDLFLRQRHELLFHQLMSLWEINVKSDSKFSELFDFMDSKRTPDYINVEGNKVTIIEVTAVMNVERAAQKKGDLTLGYKSKYDYEIGVIESNGFIVDYIVVIFDISDQGNTDYKEQINLLEQIFSKKIDYSNLSILELFRKEFCNYTKSINVLMGHYMSVLFNEPYKIKRPHLENIKHYTVKTNKLMTNCFVRVSTSNFIYDRVLFMWNRLMTLLEIAMENNKRNRHHDKFSLIFETMNNKFKFQNSTNGLKIDEWRDIIVMDKKPLLLRNLKVMNNGVKVNVRSDVEFFFYEVGSNSKRRVLFELEPFLIPHQASSICKYDHSMKNFEDKLSLLEMKLVASKHEDDNYLNDMLNKMEDFDRKMFYDKKDGGVIDYSLFEQKPFSSKVLNENMIGLAVIKFNEKMKELNNPNENNQILHVKQPFVYPLYNNIGGNYCSIKTKPFILDKIKIEGDYTMNILRNCSRQEYTFGTKHVQLDDHYNIIKNELSQLQKKASKIQKIEMREKNLPKLPRLSDIEEGKQISILISEKTKELKNYKKEHNLREKELPMIRMKTTGKSLWANAFRKEMAHFKEKKEKSNYKGVGLYDNNLQETYENLKNIMLSPSTSTCPIDILDNHVADDVNLLKQLKKEAIDSVTDFYNFIKNTNIYHSSAFISRFCHTLLYYSQNSMNSSYVAVDNLGYDNVILIIKGGKKIFTTKRSKLFRIIYPMFDEIIPWYKIPGYKTNFQFQKINGVNYCITPWMNMNETILTDGLTFHHRLMGFSLLNYNNQYDFNYNIDMIYTNLILAFHARRQTEAVMHNLRYITVNCMAILTSLDKMLPELAGFNYDCMQAFLRKRISENFMSFGMSLKEFHDKSKRKSARGVFKSMEIKSLINGHVIPDLENLACTIYSTYLMTKAPTTQSLDQVSNFKSLLETHATYLTESTDDLSAVENKNCSNLTEAKDVEEYYNKLFKSDFNYDPKFCNLMGRFCADYLMNYTTPSELHIKWDQMLNLPWDSIANSKGLRYEGSEFFGNKGYYVVYKTVLLEDPDYMSKLLSAINEDIEGKRSRSKLNELNCTFRDKIKNIDFDQVVFHVVDKQQRGGKREIYVMDWKTKLHQNPLENFSGHLCSLIPSEMISIPSNKRLSTIHTKVFEETHEDQENVCYWVLDCRKWAPRSMIQKFIHFIAGMRGVLPDSFLEHSFNFFSMLLDKHVYTREHIIEIIEKSQASKSLPMNIIKTDTYNKGKYFEMKYSWMMGIFNYFSSLMHVSNQLLSAHVINDLTARLYGEHITLHMVAHSDDSAGTITTSDNFQMIRSSFYYELMLKSSNHMLSEKKSNMGKLYYEFLSILYIGGELMSLLAKFLGAFNFHPSDSGYCVDITDSYSKAIELLLNGATLSQAYLAQKIQSNLIWRFYFNKNPTIDNYDLPPQMGGMPDSHPILTIMCGSDSDFIRLLTVKGKEYINKLLVINNELNLNDYNDDTMMDSFKTSPSVNIKDKIYELLEYFKDIDSITPWVMQNVKFNNTAMNTWQFLNNLKNKSFLSSIQDESLVRRLSRGFYYRSHPNILTKFGKISYGKLREIITTCLEMSDNESIVLNLLDVDKNDKSEIITTLLEKYKDFEGMNIKLVETIHSEPLRIMHFLNNVNFNEEDVVNSFKTCKPTHFKMNKSTLTINKRFDPSSLVAWIKEPKIRNILPDTRGFHGIQDQVRLYFEDMDISINEVNEKKLFMIFNKIKNKTITDLYLYSNMPSGYREIETYQDLLMYISHNSIRSKFISGLAIPFGKTINLPQMNAIDELSSRDVQWTIAFTNLLISIKDSGFDVNEIINLSVDTPDWIGKSEQNLHELIESVYDYWVTKHPINQLLGYHLQRLKSFNVINYRMDAKSLENMYYHTFTKRQFLVENIWLGTGMVLIGLSGIQLHFTIMNRKIVDCLQNVGTYNFTLMQKRYINLVLNESQLGNIEEHMEFSEPKYWNEICLGVEYDGSLTINYGRNQIMCMKTTNDFTLRTLLSNVSMGTVKPIKRARVEWVGGNEIEGYKKYILKTIPINVKNCVHIAGNLIKKTPTNDLVLSKISPELNDFIMDIGLNSLGVEYTIPRETLYNYYNLSELYKMFKALEEKDKLTIAGVKTRKTLYPGQSGGFLEVLMIYKELNNNFNFQWERIMSPELMLIKSSQPEAFVSEIVVKVREKYEKLFEEADKKSIMKELNLIMSKLRDSNSEKEMLILMTSWSHIGVMGALENLSGGQNVDSFKIFRSSMNDSHMMNLYYNCMIQILKSLYHCIINNFEEYSNSQQYFSSEHIFKFNLEGFKVYFVGSLHLCIFKNYSKIRQNPNSVNSSTLLFFHGLLESVLINEILKGKFSEYINCNPLLHNLPTDIKNLNDWSMLLNCLFGYLYNKEKSEGFIDFSKAIIRDDSLQLPFIKTKQLIKEIGVEINLGNPRFHGLITRSFLNKMKSNVRTEYKNQDVLVRQEFLNLELDKIQKIPINNASFFEYKLSSDFLESENLEEIVMELENPEPDEDYINEQLEEFEDEKYEKDEIQRIKYYDKLKNKKSQYVIFDVKYFINVCDSSNVGMVEYMRQMGENVVMITDVLSLNYFKMHPFLKIYRMLPNNWYGKSMVPFEFLYCYVLTTRWDDVPFWEKLLNAKYINLNDCNQLIAKTQPNKYYNNKGEMEDYMEQLNMTLEERDFNLGAKLDEDNEEAETTEEMIDQQVDHFEDILKNVLSKNAATPEHVESLRDLYNKSKESGDRSLTSDIRNIASKILSNKENVDELINLKDKVLGLEVTTREYENMNQTPQVFGSYKSRNSNMKNLALKEPKLVAEIEALMPGFSNKLISGLSTISPKLNQRVNNRIKLCRRIVNFTRKKKKAKSFLLDFYTLALNESKVTSDSPNDEGWNDILDYLDVKILEEDEESEETIKYDEEPGDAKLLHKPILTG